MEPEPVAEYSVRSVVPADPPKPIRPALGEISGLIKEDGKVCLIVQADESVRLPEEVATTLPPVSVKLKVSTPAGTGKAQTLVRAKARRKELTFIVG